jgi:hypothetical protein
LEKVAKKKTGYDPTAESQRVIPLNIPQKHFNKFYPAKAPRAQSDALCHFDPFGQAQGKLREKSFLDPSHSLGMRASARHLAYPSTSPRAYFASLRESSFFQCRNPNLIH